MTRELCGSCDATASDGHTFIVTLEPALTSGTIKVTLSVSWQFSERNQRGRCREILPPTCSRAHLFTKRLAELTAPPPLPAFPIAPGTDGCKRPRLSNTINYTKLVILCYLMPVVSKFFMLPDSKVNCEADDLLSLCVGIRVEMYTLCQWTGHFYKPRSRHLCHIMDAFPLSYFLNYSKDNVLEDNVFIATI